MVPGRNPEGSGCQGRLQQHDVLHVSLQQFLVGKSASTARLRYRLAANPCFPDACTTHIAYDPARLNEESAKALRISPEHSREYADARALWESLLLVDCSHPQCCTLHAMKALAGRDFGPQYPSDQECLGTRPDHDQAEKRVAIHRRNNPGRHQHLRHRRRRIAKRCGRLPLGPEWQRIQWVEHQPPYLDLTTGLVIPAAIGIGETGERR